MKKFNIYLKESSEDSQSRDIKQEIRDMIRKSINTSDTKTVNDFIAAYKKDSDANQIEGLINSADIYDFYLKYMDQVDEILSNNDYFKKSPDESNVYSLYDYVVIGTKEAVNYIINGLGSEDNRTDF